MSTPNLRDWARQHELSDEDTEDDTTVEMELVWLGSRKLPLGGATEAKTRRSTHART